MGDMRQRKRRFGEQRTEEREKNTGDEIKRKNIPILIEA
jgi:hypothetical protein